MRSSHARRSAGFSAQGGTLTAHSARSPVAGLAEWVAPHAGYERLRGDPLALLRLGSMPREECCFALAGLRVLVIDDHHPVLKGECVIVGRQRQVLLLEHGHPGLPLVAFCGLEQQVDEVVTLERRSCRHTCLPVPIFCSLLSVTLVGAFLCGTTGAHDAREKLVRCSVRGAVTGSVDLTH